MTNITHKPTAAATTNNKVVHAHLLDAVKWTTNTDNNPGKPTAQPRQEQTLEDLISLACNYATSVYTGPIETMASCFQAVFFIGEKGVYIYKYLPATEDSVVEYGFENVLEILGLAFGATASVCAYLKFHPEGVDEETKSAPWKNLVDITIAGKSADSQALIVCPLLRNEKFHGIGFGTPVVSLRKEEQERFPHALPINPPTAQERKRAKEVMEQIGIETYNPAKSVKLISGGDDNALFSPDVPVLEGVIGLRIKNKQVLSKKN